MKSDDADVYIKKTFPIKDSQPSLSGLNRGIVSCMVCVWGQRDD